MLPISRNLLLSFIKAIWDQIKRQLLHIYAARGSDFENAMEMTGRLYMTLALFMKGSIASKRDDTYQTYAKNGVEYIHSHYLYPITVEEIAEYVGISRKSFISCLSDITFPVTKRLSDRFFASNRLVSY